MGAGRSEALGWLAVAAGGLAAWEALAAAWEGLVPPPGVVAGYLARLEPGLVARSLYLTIVRSLAGFGLASLAALALAASAHALPAVRPVVRALNTWVQSVSALVWVIVFIVLFGVTSPLPPVLVAAAVSFPVMLSGLLGGLDSLDRRYSELARVLGASRLKELIHIVIPGLVPSLAASGRAALGVALRISVVAEALGGSGGVGYMLMVSYDRSDVPGVFAWAAVLVAAMIILDQGLLRPIESWTRRWMG